MRTQGSRARPKTQKKLGQGLGQPYKDRPSRGQGPTTKNTGASVLQNKKAIFFRRSPKKRSSNKFLLVLELRSWGFYARAYADDLAVLVTGADMLWIKGMAQKSINIAANLKTT